MYGTDRCETVTETVLSRRRYLAGVTGGVATMSGCLRFSDPAETPDERTTTAGEAETRTASRPKDTATPDADILYQEGFEGTPIGELPEKWAYHTGQEARVVSEISADGNKSLRLRGKSGGCNESVARRPIPLRDEVRLTLAVKVTSSGSIGCHDSRQARIMVRTKATGGIYPGNSLELLTFTPAGDCVARGRSLGKYTEDEWTTVTVDYRRESQRVVQAYSINGTEQATIEREPEPYENRLSALALESADFTNYWDKIQVTELP